MTMREIRTPIAVIGGTGPQGRGLVMRWARAGLPVVVGSRDAARAAKAARELNARIGPVDYPIEGLSNEDAAAEAPEVVVLTVPYAAHVSTLQALRSALAGKILVDVTVPLAEGNPRKMAMPPEGSATEQAQALLGPDAKVVAAFQNVSASLLEEVDAPIGCDILVCGDDKEARGVAVLLAELIGCRAFEVGPAASARCVEALTSILIRLNLDKRYPQLRHAGIRVVEE